MRHEIDPAWRATIAPRELESLATIEPAPHLPGEWQPLSKPGLTGRQRWRWNSAAGTTVYVKRYERQTLRDQLDRLWRQSALHSRAWWEFRVARELSESLVKAPGVVACAEQMRGAWEQASVVLLESARGDAFDRLWMAGLRDGAWFTRGRARCELARALARFVAAFHGTGYCHRDLYLCHIFAELDPQYRVPPKFCVIDLARAHRPGWRRMRWLLKDLGQLDSSARAVGATRTDRLRFLLAYLGLEAVSTRVRWYARKIVRRSNRTLARDARRAAAP